jgi:FAD dependent oxidoreductase
MSIRQMIRMFWVGVAYCCFASGIMAAGTRPLHTDVLVIGGGASGIAAGIQAARMGARTIIAEETSWLGGMLSAAGVSATDGNHLLPSGIWGEFRNRIYQHYGGPQRVATGWVSNTHFEPHVADSIFKAMARAEKNLAVYHGWRFIAVIKHRSAVVGARLLDIASGDTLVVRARQLIDATELGDVIASAGVPYSVGMEASAVTGENVQVPASNDIIQDLTHVAILKDYGKDADCTIARPAGYDPLEFDGCCLDFYNDKSRIAPGVDCAKMITYAKLPNQKYLINWPGYGNDIYLNLIGLSAEARAQELYKAKQQTLRFVYFLQHQLGYKHLGLASDEFPSDDRLALIPYHRESRRVEGLVRFKVQHISEPFERGHSLYRTGIAVGDYPIDHHHRKNPEAPQHLGFYPIPSFNVPLGSLIPARTVGLIVAEKSISVSNVVNGTTRLQPCVLLIGQAAGALAALAVQRKDLQAAMVPVRHVQRALLSSGAYLMPYADVPVGDPHFSAIQRVGATGLLRGKGQPNAWANRTWFSPDSTIRTGHFLEAIPEEMLSARVVKASSIDVDVTLTIAQSLQWILLLRQQAARLTKNRMPQWEPNELLQLAQSNWPQWRLSDFDPQRSITRRELAVLLDSLFDPFTAYGVNHQGVIQL